MLVWRHPVKRYVLQSVCFLRSALKHISSNDYRQYRYHNRLRTVLIKFAPQSRRQPKPDDFNTTTSTICIIGPPFFNSINSSCRSNLHALTKQNTAHSVYLLLCHGLYRIPSRPLTSRLNKILSGVNALLSSVQRNLVGRRKTPRHYALRLVECNSQGSMGTYLCSQSAPP